MIVELLTEHHLEFLSVNGGCRGSSESTLVKMSNCWKSHAAAHIFARAMTYMYTYVYKQKKFYSTLAQVCILGIN